MRLSSVPLCCRVLLVLFSLYSVSLSKRQLLHLTLTVTRDQVSSITPDVCCLSLLKSCPLLSSFSSQYLFKRCSVFSARGREGLSSLLQSIQQPHVCLIDLFLYVCPSLSLSLSCFLILGHIALESSYFSFSLTHLSLKFWGKTLNSLQSMSPCQESDKAPCMS